MSSTGAGVYDSAAHTVTWSHGTKDAPDPVAAGGWGHTDTRNWTSRGNSYPRKVTVNYPAANFTDDPAAATSTRP